MDRERVRSLVLFLLVVLIGAFLAFSGVLRPGRPGSGDREEPGVAPGEEPGVAPGEVAAGGAPEEGATDEGTTGTATDSADAEVDAPPEPRRLETVSLPVLSTDNPFAPRETPKAPAGTPRMVPGGRSPGRMVPWKTPRWATPPEPAGTCAVHGRVVDGNESPVDGATVYRLTPDAKPDAGSPTVYSFQYLKKAATTGKDGRFTATAMPSGDYSLVANHRRLLNRPRGMECATAEVVSLTERQTLRDVRLVVPIRTADLGGLALRAVDEHGEPVPRVRVFAGYQEGRSDAEGRCRFDGLAAGTVDVVATLTGHHRVDETFEIRKGGVTSGEIVLRLVKTGTMSVAGRVLDRQGGPVAGALVYVTHGRGTLRPSVATGADGAFAFDGLPDETGQVGVNLTVHAKGYMGGYRKDVRLPAENVDLVVDRILTFRILVRERGTSTPVKIFNLDVKREVTREGEVDLLYVAKAIVYSDEGVYDVKRTQPGRHVLFVEAPDREPVKVAFDVPAVLDVPDAVDAAGPMEVLVEM